MQHKALTAAIVAASVLLTGCNLKFGGTTISGEPYDSEFKDAHEFAEYWCGPCKEVDSYDVNGLIAHEMKDKEWGFTYIVYEGYYERGDTGIMDVYYTAETFSYYYLQTFLEEADLDEYLEENELTLDCGDLYTWKTGVISYTAELNVRTERTLTDDEAQEISTTVIDALADFDDRDFFTKSENTSEVFFTIWSAPWEKDTEVGAFYHTWTGVYGYTMGYREGYGPND